MDKSYRFTFSDGNKRILGFHNGSNTDEPLGLADVLLYLVFEGRYKLDEIVMIELISEEDEELISKDLMKEACRKIKLGYR